MKSQWKPREKAVKKPQNQVCAKNAIKGPDNPTCDLDWA